VAEWWCGVDAVHERGWEQKKRKKERKREREKESEKERVRKREPARVRESN